MEGEISGVNFVLCNVCSIKHKTSRSTITEKTGGNLATPLAFSVLHFCIGAPSAPPSPLQLPTLPVHLHAVLIHLQCALIVGPTSGLCSPVIGDKLLFTRMSIHVASKSRFPGKLLITFIA